MRLIFAGTPEVALPALHALIESDHEVVAVLTRPDAPVGRRRTLTPSPVRARADELGIPVLTPTSLREPEVQQQLRDLDADAAAVVAYGILVPADALMIPVRGWVNLHFSLLPQWRGAAPAQRAVLAGQRRTGMSVFQLEEGLDTGPVLGVQEVEVGEFETAGDLLERMATSGADLLVRTLDEIAAGTAQPVPQAHDDATSAPKLSPAEARIDFAQPAERVDAQIRGMSPHPGAWTSFRGGRFKILGTEKPTSAPALDAGRIAVGERGQVLVGTATTPIAVAVVGPAGKRAMRAADWARGAALTADEAFDMEEERE